MCAHYHFRVDEGDLKIARINYWTESHRPDDDYEPLFDLWARDKAEALTVFGTKHLRGEL